MSDELDISNFEQISIIYSEEFENILSKIYICYQYILADNVVLTNNENAIRDILYLNYLNNDAVRAKILLTDYLFSRESMENNSNGRVDLCIKNEQSFIDTDAYYIIECKRLNGENQAGTTGLNAEYIKEGINRFTTNKYSCYYGVNGMLGFVVNKINIHHNINHINTLMTNKFQSNANVITSLTKANFIDNYDYHYYSVHEDENNKQFTLYHLMFDFSNNILSNENIE